MKINLVIKVQESCLYNLECMQGTKKLSIWILLHSSVPPGTKVLLVFPVIMDGEVWFLQNLCCLMTKLLQLPLYAMGTKHFFSYLIWEEEE